MKNYYIKQNRVIIYDKDLSGSVDVSTDINDIETHFIAMTDEQIEFYEANKTASVREIYNCQLNEIAEVEPVQPTAEELRRAAYAMERIISWQNELLTCDEALLRLSKYREIEDARHSELQVLYKNAINEIKQRIV